MDAGIPEAVGTGITKLVDINPAIGILVAGLFVALAAVTKWGLDGWKEARGAKEDHLEYVKAQLLDAKAQIADERKDREVFERMVERLDDRGRK